MRDKKFGFYLNPPRRRVIDIKAGNDMVKENGGKVCHIAPIIGGFVVYCTHEVADVCSFIPWE